MYDDDTDVPGILNMLAVEVPHKKAVGLQV